MSLVQIFLIAFALAMDAFAVSVAAGFAIPKVRIRHALTYGLWFGAFQAIMPLAGWLGGRTLSRYISEIDHWIAFGLLLLIGGKMIYESFQIEEVEKEKNPLDTKVLFILALATSIDALAVGLSFALLNVTVLLPVVIIGVVTFILSYAGVYIGAKGGHFFERKIEVVGGLILIAIGLKILWSHLVA
jgi:putative Mn2+ efflux pump MntP